MGLKYRRQRKGNISMTSSVIIGVVIAVLFTIAAAALIALLVTNEQLPLGSLGYGVVAIWVVSALLGGSTAGKTATEKKLVACLVTCGVYLLLLLGISITLFDSIGQSVWVGILSIIIGCGGAVLVALRPKKGARRLRKMRISR